MVTSTNLSVVDADNAANHLGHDNHVTEMGLDDSRLFIWRCLLLCLTELLDEAHRLALETALEPSASTSMNEFNELQDMIGYG